jgi:hypothetical protein
MIEREKDSDKRWEDVKLSRTSDKWFVPLTEPVVTWLRVLLVAERASARKSSVSCGVVMVRCGLAVPEMFELNIIALAASEGARVG